MKDIETVVLLVNLGTPNKPQPFAIARFLSAFLSDKRVVELPSILWWFILNLIVIPKRILKVTKAYRAIWTPEGSPLKVNTEQLAKGLTEQLSKKINKSIAVEYAMTYGEPTIKSVIQRILKSDQFSSSTKSHNIKKLIVLPLYPQYSTTTSGAVFDAVSKTLMAQRVVPTLCFIHEYALEPSYLEALRDKIWHFWNTNGKPERLLISFHGLPQRTVLLGDTYVGTCFEMANRLIKMCNFPENFCEIGFQSRFTRRWTEPASLLILDRWAKVGIRNVDIIAPSFAVDCLETLEELTIEHAAYFKKSGGENLRYIPALNNSAAHIDALIDIISKNL